MKRLLIFLTAFLAPMACFGQGIATGTGKVTGVGTISITPFPAVTVTPSPLNFGNVTQGTSSTSQVVTIRNTGVTTLTIVSITITAQYSYTTNCTSSLVGSATCTVNVTFSPVGAGTVNGTLTVNDNAQVTPQTVSLTGTGVVQTPPIVTLSPGSLAFGNQTQGTSSASQGISLQNTGGAALSITSIVASAQYSQTNNCPVSLSVSASCTINVVFSPSGTGSISGSVTFTDNAAGSPQTVSLSGTGVVPAAQLSVGWTRIASSTAAAVAPNPATFTGIQGGEGYAGVMDDWTGGWADTKRNRLCFWGGGHAGYYGNEVYCMDPANTPHIFRLTDPANNPVSQCNGTVLQNLIWANNTPNQVHGYGGASYIPVMDQTTQLMGHISRGNNNCPTSALNGSGGNFWGGWRFKLNEIDQNALPNASGHWAPLDPLIGGTITYRAHSLCTNGSCTHLGWARDVSNLGEQAVTCYDAPTQSVLAHDQFALYSYDPANETGMQLNVSGNLNTSSSGTLSGACDPVHRYYVTIGNGAARRFHIDTFATDSLDAGLTGCATPLGSRPGIQFDPTMQMFVLWGTASDTRSVWLFNASDSAITTTNYGSVGAKTCVQVTPALNSTGPVSGPLNIGNTSVNGHFSVLPNLNGQDVYGLCVNMNADCWALVLNAASTAGHKTFAQRAASPGVVYSNSLSTNTLVTNGAAASSCNGAVLPAFDATAFPPGDGLPGSAKFTTAAACADLAGSWQSGTFGPFGPPTHPGMLGSTFYVQFRFLQDATQANFNWGASASAGQKFVIFHNGSSTCNSIELTTQDLFGRGYPQMYTNCGASGFEKDLGNGDFLYQFSLPEDTTVNNQWRYNCHRNFASTIECSYVNSPHGYSAGWVTFYYKVTFTGEWNTSNNATVQAWMSYDKGTVQPDGLTSDGTLRMWMNRVVTLDCNNSPGCRATGSTEGYNDLDFLMYETAGAPAGAPTNAHRWYSGLIVSQQPIPAPDGPTPVN